MNKNPLTLCAAGKSMSNAVTSGSVSRFDTVSAVLDTNFFLQKIKNIELD